MIRQYIRENGTNRKIGVLVAWVIDGNVSIGFSALNKKDDRIFSSDFGNEIAESRAICYAQEKRYPKCLPLSVQKALPLFIDRCQSYFKEVELVDWVHEWV